MMRSSVCTCACALLSAILVSCCAVGRATASPATNGNSTDTRLATARSSSVRRPNSPSILRPSGNTITNIAPTLQPNTASVSPDKQLLSTGKQLSQDKQLSSSKQPSLTPSKSIRTLSSTNPPSPNSQQPHTSIPVPPLPTNVPSTNFPKYTCRLDESGTHVVLNVTLPWGVVPAPIADLLIEYKRRSVHSDRRWVPPKEGDCETHTRNVGLSNGRSVDRSVGLSSGMSVACRLWEVDKHQMHNLTKDVFDLRVSYRQSDGQTVRSDPLPWTWSVDDLFQCFTKEAVTPDPPRILSVDSSSMTIQWKEASVAKTFNFMVDGRRVVLKTRGEEDMSFELRYIHATDKRLTQLKPCTNYTVCLITEYMDDATGHQFTSCSSTKTEGKGGFSCLPLDEAERNKMEDKVVFALIGVCLSLVVVLVVYLAVRHRRMKRRSSSQEGIFDQDTLVGPRTDPNSHSYYAIPENLSHYHEVYSKPFGHDDSLVKVFPPPEETVIFPTREPTGHVYTREPTREPAREPSHDEHVTNEHVVSPPVEVDDGNQDGVEDN